MLTIPTSITGGGGKDLGLVIDIGRLAVRSEFRVNPPTPLIVFFFFALLIIFRRDPFTWLVSLSY